MQQWISDFNQWLHDAITQIIEFLDPVIRVQMLFIWGSEFLPDQPENIEFVIEQTRLMFISFAEFIAYLDYFINLPFLGACLVLMALTESLLMVLRGWRVLRSLAT